MSDPYIGEIRMFAGAFAPQGWEFYAVTGALFLVLAFPGFTWRYLMKHRAAA